MVTWIAPKNPSNDEFAKMMMRENPRLKVLHMQRSAEFIAWFNKEGHLVKDRLRVMTNAYRPGDGDGEAADYLIKSIEFDERARAIPVCVYCGNPKPVEHLKKKALVTSSPAEAKAFVLGTKPTK